MSEIPMEMPALVASAKAKFLQFVQRRDGFCRARDLVTAPDNVAKLLLAGGSVEKSKLLGPNLIENDAARSGFDDVLASALP